MKRKILRVGKSSMSIILAVMMIMSTMLIGTITTANAATMSGGSVVYLYPNHNDWKNNNERYAIYVYNVGNTNGWADMTAVSGTDYYSATIPSGTWSNIIFVRMNGSTTENNWDNKWSQTQDLAFVDGKNLFEVNTKDSNGKYNGTWSTYTPSSSDDDSDETTSNVVYLDNKANWTDCYAYAWYNNNSSDIPTMGRWPGTKLTKTDANGVYIVEYGDATTIIFNNGNSGDGNQTGDLEITPGKVYNNSTKEWTDYTPVEETEYTVTYGRFDENGTLTAKTSTGTIESGTKVAENSAVTFTATPSTNYKVEGWYSDAYCTEKITDAGTSTTYEATITSDTTVYVKFEEGTQIDTPTYSDYYYQSYAQSGDYMVKSGAKQQFINGSEGFAYVELTGTGSDAIFLVEYNDQSYYYNGDIYKSSYNNDFDLNISNHNANVAENDNKSFAKTNVENNLTYYVVVLFPKSTYNTTDNFIVAATTTLPGGPDTYKVTMNQGVSSTVDGVGAMGKSDLNETEKSTLNIPKDDLTVRFRTKTTYVDNDTLDYAGYMYQVYGYSVLMTLQDGTTQVVGVMNPIDDPNSNRPITELANGEFMYDFVFPNDIKSAVVTPIFTVSADYAKEKGITFTKIYLKITPGKNDLNNQYEPHYYTWRTTTDGSTVVVNENNIEREPEGTYPGQKMVHSNDDMYVAYVQSDVYGLLFSDGRPGSGSWNQTFDYDEFRKLQKLGYNNITFEVMPAKSETIASTINNNIDGYGDTTKTLRNGSKTYFTVADDGTVSYTGTYTIDAEAQTDAEFVLDVNFEGDYIDVFGNPLLDTNGNEINREAFVAANNLTTVSAELEKLLAVTGKSNKLYGARYGWYTTTNDDYGMEYAVRTYYIDGTNNKLISQQISGYGTIEGAVSPIDSSKTNAQNNGSLVYYEGNRTSSTAVNYTEKTFSTGYELIPETYLGVPYLVSYKSPTTSVATTWDKGQSGATRIDGKWYYMSTTPQITVNAKVGLMDDSGKVIMSSNGVIAENTGIGCTATVNGLDSSTIDQGTLASLGATAGAGYKFVGFYQADGTFIFDANPHEMVFSSNTTVYAVFQKLASGTLTVTNNIYAGSSVNPQPGGGRGSVTVALYITPYNETTDTYGDEVAYIGTNNSISVQIKDGDLYRWEITGTPSGIDDFLTFRIAETTADGSIYYSALDDESCLSQSGTTYTYSSYQGVWNWYQQTGSEDASYKTIDLFTDFSKTSIYAILNYKYKNRFGEVRTYTVKNVLLSEAEDYDPENPYTPTPSIILKYAPPIDEVFTSCEWKVTGTDLSNAEIGKSVATLTAVQTPKKFYTYVDNNENPLPTSSYDYFNTLITISAPEVIVDEVTGEIKTFSYWERYLTNEKGEYDENAFDVFSYERTVGIRVSFNSLFKAVYGKTKDPYTTNLQDAIYTREKYTDEKGNTADYVYADFLLQFETSNPNNTFADLVKDSYDIETNKYDIKFGIFTERDIAASDFTGGDVDAAAPEKNTDLVANTIMGIAKDLGSGGSASTWSLADSTSEQYNYYYTAYDLTNRVEDLTILGRYDFYFRFTNNEINRSKVYNVYTYIIYTDKEGIEHIVISNGKTMCIYDTGIKEDGSAGITNTD